MFDCNYFLIFCNKILITFSNKKMFSLHALLICGDVTRIATVETFGRVTVPSVVARVGIGQLWNFVYRVN